MGPTRFRIRTLMITVVVVAVAFALIPIVHRTLYPDSFSIYYFYVGDTFIFSIEF